MDAGESRRTARPENQVPVRLAAQARNRPSRAIVGLRLRVVCVPPMVTAFGPVANWRNKDAPPNASRYEATEITPARKRR
jgi:hypothetical protein